MVLIVNIKYKRPVHARNLVTKVLLFLQKFKVTCCNSFIILIFRRDIDSNLVYRLSIYKKVVSKDTGKRGTQKSWYGCVDYGVCYNHVQNILRVFDILPSFSPTTSKRGLGY